MVFSDSSRGKTLEVTFYVCGWQLIPNSHLPKFKQLFFRQVYYCTDTKSCLPDSQRLKEKLYLAPLVSLHFLAFQKILSFYVLSMSCKDVIVFYAKGFLWNLRLRYFPVTVHIVCNCYCFPRSSAWKSYCRLAWLKNFCCTLSGVF